MNVQDLFVEYFGREEPVYMISGSSNFYYRRY